MADGQVLSFPPCKFLTLNAHAAVNIFLPTVPKTFVPRMVAYFLLVTIWQH